jgi:hypothetical protein
MVERPIAGEPQNGVDWSRTLLKGLSSYATARHSFYAAKNMLDEGVNRFNISIAGITAAHTVAAMVPDIITDRERQERMRQGASFFERWDTTINRGLDQAANVLTSVLAAYLEHKGHDGLPFTVLRLAQTCYNMKASYT